MVTYIYTYIYIYMYTHFTTPLQETICGDVAAQGDDAVSVLQPCWQLGATVA